MIHSSGAVNVPSRVYIDGVGTQTTAPHDSAYAAFIGRYARNTVADPQPAEAGDIIVRFGGNGYADQLALNSISNVRMDMVATETQTNTGRGTRIELWTTPNGSAVPQRSAHIDSGGIDFTEATDVDAGVTFKNGSLLKYWPDQTNNDGKVLRTDGTDFFWSAETVPAGQVLFKGDWSAANPPSGGTPTISDATGQAGWQWIVSAEGTQDLGSGDISFAVGDLVIHNGTRYVKIDGTTPQVQADWTETNSALPAYIKHKPTLATVATSGSYLDLSNRPSIPAAQINSDWNASSGLAQILNKPTIPSQYTDTQARNAISLTTLTPSGTTSTLTYVGGVFTFTSAVAPTAPVNADWTSDAGLSKILNKPSLFSGNYNDLTNKPSLFSGNYNDLSNKPSLFSGNYNDLTNKPSIPAAQIQSDWNQTNVANLDYIKNKPTLTNGTVTSVSGNGTVSGLTLTGTVTSSGNLTLGGTLDKTSSTVFGIAKVDGTTITANAGVISAVNTNGIGGNQLVYELNGSLSLTSAKNTLVSLFGLTSGVALQSNTRYHYEIVFTFSSNKAGILSYALALNGGAVVAQHNFQWMANKTTTIDSYSAGIAMASTNATGAGITTAKAIADFDNFNHVVIYGIIDVTTAGSVNFMVSQDQNTPITWTVLPGAYVKLLPLGAIGANTVAGSWT
jgi:hypothetical protein